MTSEPRSRNLSANRFEGPQIPHWPTQQPFQPRISGSQHHEDVNYWSRSGSRWALVWVKVDSSSLSKEGTWLIWPERPKSSSLRESSTMRFAPRLRLMLLRAWAWKTNWEGSLRD